MSKPLTDRAPIADRAPARRTIVILLVSSGVLLIAFIAVAYVLSAASAFGKMAETETHIYESPLFATAVEATKACGIKLPQEARNIQIVSRSEWLEYEEYVRFEA